MVCSLGSGRMAVMARLLAAGRFSQTKAEEFVHQKSAAEYISRELREADEANLLDEEDMHMFGLKPMTDPLHLVCCKACKKPIKASQYAAHAELCRSLQLTGQIFMDHDGSTGNRKPPRKEKKKLSTSLANLAAAVGERGRSESMDAIDTAGSQSYLNSQIGVTSISDEAKGYSSCVDAASMMDGTGINPGNRDHPASVMHPPSKRHKLIAGSHLTLPENSEVESGAAKTARFPDGITLRDSIERSVSEQRDYNHKLLGLVHQQHIMKKDYPAPLATKIYYSQRNNRLRSALSHLYFQESSKELCTDVVSPNLLHEKMIAVQDSSPRDPSLEQKDDLLKMESPSQTLCLAQSPSHILARSSEICMHKAGGLPSGGLSNQFIVDNVSRPAATPVGLTRSNFLSKPYSFASNKGNPMGAIQQPNGSVPVI